VSVYPPSVHVQEPARRIGTTEQRGGPQRTGGIVETAAGK